MKEIVIYVEGAGPTAQQKADLRVGLDGLLGPQKRAACQKRIGWRLVPAQGRDHAHQAFRNALSRADTETVVVLLVDSEGPVPPETGDPAGDAAIRVQHLACRDGWDFRGVDSQRIHLMVQCLETWIVADADALERYFGKGFRRRALPDRLNLEEEPKPEVYKKLDRAVRDSAKAGKSQRYAKLAHERTLLPRLSPDKIAARCPRFRTFTAWLTRVIDAT